MFTLLSPHFIANLLILNGFLVVCFLIVYHYYSDILGYIDSLSVSAKTLDEKQKKELRKYFPFYNKLSPRLQRLFEQRLIYFYYRKEYTRSDDTLVLDRMRLFISAYAAQVSLGFREYGFSHVFRVKIYPVRFYSSGKEQLVSWELDEDGTLHLSWKDFFCQLRKEIVLPIGLEIMAFAIKKDKSPIKDDIYRIRALLYQHTSSVSRSIASPSLFRYEDFQTKEDFLEACIKNYFSHPTELKNTHPDLFHKIDKLLYSQLHFV